MDAKIEAVIENHSSSSSEPFPLGFEIETSEQWEIIGDVVDWLLGF